MTFMGASLADLRQLDSTALSSLCANDPENSDLWSEFLRRFTPKIRFFIRGTLRQSMSGIAHVSDSAVYLEAAQEIDLFQNTILRLVENNCAALRRFSGTTEAELLAYFAVIARSTVRDYFRRQRARKRLSWPAVAASKDVERLEKCDPHRYQSENSMERKILARELEQLSLQTIRNNSGEPERDQLIFQLYFFDGLSTAQIAACKGIGLSKTGIEKTLNRLKDRVRSAVTSAHSTEVRE